MSSRPASSRIASGTAPVKEGAKPLYAQVRDALRTRILDATLPAGSRIPSESELTREHQVSRITVRQALSDLQKEGLIFRVHGKGTFVSAPPVGQDLTRLRGLSESLSAEGHDVHNRRLSLIELNAPSHVAKRLAVSEHTRVIRIETLRYLDRRPLSIDTLWVPLPIGRRLAKANLETRDVLDIYENELGLELGPADVTIEATLANREQAKHLRVDVGAPILHVERLIHLADSRPIQLDFITYRGDAFRYRLSVERNASTR
jgi:GntR family transcriptional regulator